MITPRRRAPRLFRRGACVCPDGRSQAENAARPAVRNPFPQSAARSLAARAGRSASGIPSRNPLPDPSRRGRGALRPEPLPAIRRLIPRGAGGGAGGGLPPGIPSLNPPPILRGAGGDAGGGALRPESLPAIRCPILRDAGGGRRRGPSARNPFPQSAARSLAARARALCARNRFPQSAARSFAARAGRSAPGIPSRNPPPILRGAGGDAGGGLPPGIPSLNPLPDPSRRGRGCRRGRSASGIPSRNPPPDPPRRGRGRSAPGTASRNPPPGLSRRGRGALRPEPLPAIRRLIPRGAGGALCARNPFPRRGRAAPLPAVRRFAVRNARFCRFFP